ncbi:hypothetical protein [Actinomadura chibensis]|uniref:Uncharacterized protein n=1 Tax=Actinomadura chibensis TaxID=392828 RepID=A0A5D0NQF2_9ACTN|nr:hypothetical protein [Actinomadura chibensis]TYB46358.1 hypothetical protein FXF69_13915 [Actinomadura chibensis]
MERDDVSGSEGVHERLPDGVRATSDRAGVAGHRLAAGAPELLRRYEQASPAARAVLWAAMDARRLGHSLFLPERLLRDAAPGYLDDNERPHRRHRLVRRRAG